MNREGKGIVFDIQRYSVHDGPGIRTLVFMKGCPLRCRWCSNPEGLAAGKTIMFVSRLCMGCGACEKVCQAGAITVGEEGLSWDRKKCTNCLKCTEACKYKHARKVCGKEYTIGELLEEVEKDLIFYRRSGGGLTVGGGEPLMQAEFVSRLMEAAREKLGINTAVETSSYGPWERAKLVYEQADTIQTDIKHMDEKQHRKFTGVSNRPILDNIQRAAGLLDKKRQTLVIRIPVIPGINDSDENVIDTAEFARSLHCVERLELLPYHNLGEVKYDSVTAGEYPLKGLKRKTDEAMEDLCRKVRACGMNVHVGGL